MSKITRNRPFLSRGKPYCFEAKVSANECNVKCIVFFKELYLVASEHAPIDAREQATVLQETG